MSESELSNLVYLSVESSAQLFQFWLSGSFAVVMVFYFGSGKLNGPMLKLVATLYVLASVTFSLYWIGGAVQYAEYINRMAEQGYDTSHLDNIYGWLGGAGMLSVFVIGTLGVLYYLLWEFRHRNDNT